MLRLNYTKKLFECLKNNDFQKWNSFNEVTNSQKFVDFNDSKFPIDNGQRVFSRYQFNNIKFNNTVFLGIATVRANFYGALFENCSFELCRFEQGDFEGATFENCFFKGSKSKYLIFRSCNFNRSSFTKNSKLNYVDFEQSTFVKTTFSDCKISFCKVYGTNLWDINIKNCEQRDYIINDSKNILSNRMIVCDIEIAHIINLLCDNSKFSNLISSAQSNFILILGRFGEHKYKLDALKEKIISETVYSPIIFDWDNQDSNLDFIETIIFLTGFSKFIIVDISDPKSVPAELQAILSTIMVPVFPLLQKNQDEYAVFSSIKKYHWVNNLIIYDDFDKVLDKFKIAILEPAENMSAEINKIKSKLRSKNIDDI